MRGRHADVTAPIKCDKCPRTFRYDEAYNVHYSWKHDPQEKLFECEVCHQMKNRIHCRNHKAKQDRRYPCSKCDMAFALSANLRVHMETHATSRNFRCHICNQFYRGLLSLKTHIRVRHKQGQLKLIHQCPDCGVRFQHEHTLQRHRDKQVCKLTESEKKKQKSEDIHPCYVCDKVFSSRSDRTHHMKTHASESKIKPCHICGKVFSSRNGRTLHMKMHALGASRKFGPCVICGKCFMTCNGLTNHMKAHAREKSYVCDECGDAFDRKAHLVRHVRLIHKTKNYSHQCSTCGQICRTAGALQIHEHSHTGEMPHKCNVCACAFGSVTQLTQHRLDAHADLLIACHLCGLKFTTPKAFRTHKWSKHRASATKEHTELLQCTVSGCDYQTHQPNLLRSHVYRHSEIGRYRCNVCEQRFRNDYTLKKHLMNHMTEQVDPHTITGCNTASGHVFYASSIKVFRCELCPRVYCGRGILNAHVRKTHKIDTRVQVTV